MYYIICSTPRSGSTLLAEALTAMGAGLPEEYFNPETTSGSEIGRRENFMLPTPEAYIERLKRAYTVNGIFGIKIHYYDFANAPDIINRLSQFFPNAHYIAITRRNILRQAVSTVRGKQTKAWRSHLREQKRPRFSYLSILKYLILTAEYIEQWEAFYALQGIKPLRILYEDLDEDYEGTMRKVASFLGINGNIPPPPLKKQSDAITEVWIERFIGVFRNNEIVSRAGRFLAKFW